MNSPCPIVLSSRSVQYMHHMTTAKLVTNGGTVFHVQENSARWWLGTTDWCGPGRIQTRLGVRSRPNEKKSILYHIPVHLPWRHQWESLIDSPSGNAKGVSRPITPLTSTKSRPQMSSKGCLERIQQAEVLLEAVAFPCISRGFPRVPDCFPVRSYTESSFSKTMFSRELMRLRRDRCP